MRDDDIPIEPELNHRQVEEEIGWRDAVSKNTLDERLANLVIQPESAQSNILDEELANLVVHPEMAETIKDMRQEQQPPLIIHQQEK